MAFLQAVFVGLVGVSFVSLNEQAIKSARGPQYAVTVGIGQGLKESDSLGGNVPGVSLWTARGEAIGGALGSGRILPDAKPYEVQFSGNRSLGDGQAPVEYISVTNGGDDAICVAYVSVAEPSGTKRVFMGENGHTCGADWYPSTLVVGETRPKCIWIGRNRSHGLRFQGMGIHMPSFSNSETPANQGLAKEFKANTDTMCKSGPRFKMYESLNGEDPILFFDPPFTEDSFNQDGSDKDISKIINNPGKMTDINLKLANEACESGSGCPHIHGLIGDLDQKFNPHKRNANAPWMSDQLVVSDHAEHSAVEVCKSETSRGPDFLSTQEMKYCDMDTKTVWNVCSDSSAPCCFDVEAQRMRSCGHWVRSVSRMTIPNKRYSKITKWGA